MLLSRIAKALAKTQGMLILSLHVFFTLYLRGVILISRRSNSGLPASENSILPPDFPMLNVRKEKCYLLSNLT